MRVIINPGSGPVTDATEEQAWRNIEEFVAELGLRGVRADRAPERDYGAGRFCFDLRLDDRRCEIQMPGITDEQRGGMLFGFPRLYVDDSSWIWSIAHDVVLDRLRGPNDD